MGIPMMDVRQASVRSKAALSHAWSTRQSVSSVGRISPLIFRKGDVRGVKHEVDPGSKTTEQKILKTSEKGQSDRPLNKHIYIYHSQYAHIYIYMYICIQRTYRYIGYSDDVPWMMRFPLCATLKTKLMASVETSQGGEGDPAVEDRWL